MYNTSLIKFFILYFCSLNVCSIQVSCTDTFQCSALGTYMPPRTLASTARCPPVSVRTDVPPGRSHPTPRPRPPSPPPRGPGSSSRRRAAGRAGLEAGCAAAAPGAVSPPCSARCPSRSPAVGAGSRGAGLAGRAVAAEVR